MKLAANPEAYVPLNVLREGTPPTDPPLPRCPSTMHGATNRPLATTRGTYLPDTPSAQEVAYCSGCALHLGCAGLFRPYP